MRWTIDSSFQSSNTLKNTGVWSLIELVSLYTVPLSTVNSLSRLTTTSNGQAWPIWSFSNLPITFELNRMELNGRFEFESNLCRSLHKPDMQFGACSIVQTSSQPLMMLLAVSVYDPLTWIVSLFLAVDLARTAVGLFITLARQSGTHCQMNLEILTVLMALNDSWNDSFQLLLVSIAH